MDSSSSSSATMVTKQEFNAFHKFDRALFSRLVLNLRRDITQSFHIMSFFLYLEKNALMSNLIVNLVSLPDFFINSVADEVMMCLTCLSYEEFSTFVANFRQNINSLTIPLVTRMTGEQVTLSVIHQNRENILLEMKKHLTRICYPTFEDICVHADMFNKEKMYSEEREKSLSHIGTNMAQNLSDQQHQEKTNHVSGTSKVFAFSEDDRTVFLTFSRGYPISEAEVHSFFTRRFGDIIEAIHMPEVEGNEQALYAKMVLHSAAKVTEIVSGDNNRNKFTINGKHVKVRKYIPKPSNGSNLPPSFGVSL